MKRSGAVAGDPPRRRSWVAGTGPAMTVKKVEGERERLRVLLLQFRAEGRLGAGVEGLAAGRIDEGIRLARVQRRLLLVQAVEAAVGGDEDFAGERLPGGEGVLVVGGLAGVGLCLAELVARQHGGGAVDQGLA